ncbi:uncharacterized protein PADG_03548 [Paracoccidioides brasiliensis Pb18]|uniref:Uncharacterized protein n=1 Tax=Paracoccidioides brasiliensis (strain Pb18) TaxID=502780 RepID=C1G8G2_PARBD|nr:uncharacterized protein PADG_03548 [Paracoccidioides brasiliensis Pb18]EEH47464.1 hypothetical protein PADG_03548 [Paracoccidioides brasiliensis Pb18]ODH49545.1 hypothetical protein GX48_04332 [Paracoccidioides brasiliensis]
MASDHSVADKSFSEKENEILKGSAATSIHSVNTAETLLNTSSSFTPGPSLFIDARGKELFRLPTPTSQLEIHISNPDGSLAYLSTREKRWSGNCTLSSPQGGNLISTEYFFGPNKAPIIRRSAESEKVSSEIKVTGKWISRTTNFATPDGSAFEWRYVKERGPDGKKQQLMVLEKIEIAGRRRVAHLLRNEQTMPAKTSTCTAGNGGELVFDRNAFEVMDEALVVTTCLLMLKKEIDRRRTLQTLVIMGAAGGN